MVIISFAIKHDYQKTISIINYERERERDLITLQ